VTKFLITRCTTYDMAGQAMINGAINGLTQIYPDAEFNALVFSKDSSLGSPTDQFLHPQHIEIAFEWADCVIDLGGLCKGFDPYRVEYILRCKELDIPYIYMAVSFEHPSKEMVQDIPASARGIHSAAEYTRVTGKVPMVVPDISFMIKPTVSSERNYVTFTTHKGKPWASFFKHCKNNDARLIQVVFKPDNSLAQWEPDLGIRVFHGPPEELYGFIGSADKVYTCRYHAAVAAIMGGVEFELPVGMPNLGKYNDLGYWIGMKLKDIRDQAMYACELVQEVLHG
jgi:hypothetical protein